MNVIKWLLFRAPEFRVLFHISVDYKNKPYLIPRKTGLKRFGDLPRTALAVLGIRI